MSFFDAEDLDTKEIMPATKWMDEIFSGKK
jgi:hypothetical protein